MAKQLTIGDLLFRIGYSNEDEFVADLEKLVGKADKTTEKAGEQAGKKGGRAAGRGFNESFKATFTGAALGSFVGVALERAFAGALTAAVQFTASSVREFAVYEQGLLQLQLAGEKNLSALSKRIQDTAKASRVFSATDISLAVGDLVKAGYDAETAFALVETGVLGAASEVDAATGKFGDLSTTAGQLGNILRALGYDTSQAGRVMDVMARAAQDSNLDVSDLVDIIARVGPTAKLAGLEIEDLAAQAAVLSNNGMEASLIGTGLRSVLQSLINPSGAMKGQLEALGISLVDSNGNLRDFNDVLDGLHELTQRGGEGLQILTQATGSYGSTAAASLGSASETVKEFRANMEDAEGSAQELADTMRNSGAGAAAEYEARMADARAELGERLMPHLVTLHETVLPALVTVLGTLIDKWTDWEFIITGTTTALRQQQEALEEQVLAGLGDELGQALLDLMDARQAVADAEAAVARGWRGGVFNALGARAQLDAAREALAIAEDHYETQLAQHRLEQQRAGFTFDGQGELPFGPLAPGQARPAAAGVVEPVIEAYRNLAAVEAELAEARQQFAAATTAEEERQIAARIKLLEAEVAAKKGLYAEQQAAAKAAGSTRDPLAEEAQRVQNDLQRLKLSYEQGTLSREAYVEAQEAHLRRLDGLYSRVTSPEQSLAVLRAQKAFLDELARLEDQAAKEMEDIRAVNKDREEEQRYPSTLDAAGLAQLRRRIRNRETAIARAEQEEREAAMAEARRASRHRVQARDDRPSITGVFQTPEDVRRWVEEQNRAEVEAEKRKQEELARLRDEALEANQRRLAESRAASRRVEEEARRLGISVTQELRAGTLEGLEELEAELVQLLSELGDDPSAAPLVGLLTQTRSAIANVTEATREQESEQRKLIRAHNEYTESLKRARQAEIDRALGGTTRLVQAQRALGTATREDVRAALEEQITTLDGLIARTAEGTETWYDYVAALEAARAALDALNQEVPDFRMPDLGSADAIRRAFTQTESMIASLRERIATETDETVIALLEQRIAQYTALLQQLGIAVAELDQAVADGATKDELERQATALASDLMRVAESFPRAIVEGIRTGDIGSALEQALGGAADYFLDMMLKSILGPITEELTSAITKSLTARAAGDAASGAAGAAGGLGALGPTGFILGGVAILASMLAGASRSRQSAVERNQQTVRAAVSGAPSVTYNLAANVEVNSNAAWTDPAFTARWRSETEALVVSLLSKVRR